MSLSGNTEKINSLITAINNLPNAGESGGGSGGTVETCTVSLLLSDPDDTVALVAYQTPNGANLLTTDETTAAYELQCVAPSVISLANPSYRGISISGEIETIFEGNDHPVFYVTGDSTITII